MGAYRAAIERYVTPQDCVADIGTGTGVLALLAAAKNPRKVYAVERSKPLIDYARASAAANGIDNVIFIASSSRKFRPAEPVDVVVQEQMGIALFDEDMVETIIDVRDRCLKPGGKILPARFDSIRAGSAACGRAGPHDLGVANLRFYASPAPDRVAAGLFPRDCAPADRFLAVRAIARVRVRSHGLTREELPRRFSVRKPVKRPGQLDGICMYFRAVFDDEIAFSTAPMRSRPIGRCFSTGRRRKHIDRAKSLRSRSGFPISPTTSNGHGISADIRAGTRIRLTHAV